MAECFGFAGSLEIGSMMHEMKNLMRAMADLFRQIKISMHKGTLTPKKISSIKEVVINTKKDIEDILKETSND